MKPEKSRPSLWLINDGRAGHMAQIKAVTAALQESMALGDIQALDIKARAPWIWLPTHRWPFLTFALDRKARQSLSQSWPDIWVAAGRRTAPFTRAVKRWSHGKTFTLQLLNPGGPLTDFDRVCLPAHDDIHGPNVLQTIGALAHFPEGSKEVAKETFPKLFIPGKKRLAVLLGGRSKTHAFTHERGVHLVDQLKALHAEGWHLMITASRRTPDFIIEQIERLSAETASDLWTGKGDGPNPYTAYLYAADAALVTCDSANMLCEAAWHGLPVHMIPLKGRSAKFDRLYKSLIERHSAQWFDGAIKNWRAAPLREADRIAEAVIEALRFQKI